MRLHGLGQPVTSIVAAAGCSRKTVGNELATAKLSGLYERVLAKCKKYELLVIDEFMLNVTTKEETCGLYELVEGRSKMIHSASLEDRRSGARGRPFAPASRGPGVLPTRAAASIDYRKLLDPPFFGQRGGIKCNSRQKQLRSRPALAYSEQESVARNNTIV